MYACKRIRLLLGLNMHNWTGYLAQLDRVPGTTGLGAWHNVDRVPGLGCYPHGYEGRGTLPTKAGVVMLQMRSPVQAMFF